MWRQVNKKHNQFKEDLMQSAALLILGLDFSDQKDQQNDEKYMCTQTIY